MQIYSGPTALPSDLDVDVLADLYVDVLTDLPDHAAHPVVSNMEARTPLATVRAVPFRNDEVDVSPIGFENSL